MDNAPKGWNFRNFGYCWDWCCSDSSVPDSNVCCWIIKSIIQGAQTIVDTLLDAKLTEYDTLAVSNVQRHNRMYNTTQTTVLWHTIGLMIGIAVAHIYRVWALTIIVNIHTYPFC